MTANSVLKNVADVESVYLSHKISYYTGLVPGVLLLLAVWSNILGGIYDVSYLLGVIGTTGFLASICAVLALGASTRHYHEELFKAWGLGGMTMVISAYLSLFFLLL